MTNRELDKWIHINIFQRVVLADHNYDDTHCDCLPRYTESISDAFQVVDKMEEKGFTFGLWKTLDNQWRASFSKQHLHCDIWADSEVRSLAICLAAKKAVEA